MLRLEDYQQHADDCRRMAGTTKNPDHRKMLEDMADAWEALASEREHFLERHSAPE
jgi:hypothetical protein